ncbi:Kelch repeat-containing protein [Marinicella gelatinilytica]|uniref:Kelch repeat-containing protein n=1 Tax=Marinicella gelatinilytica TaxID=2996017 RepID=UPI002260CED8|nr:hypothetical protein [Marinicella gelatinilytica]MCX7544978.1 hypothetical protein [Marinicella gelatinilytica]
MIVLSQFQKSVVILVILGLSFSIGAKNKLSEINWLDSSQYYDSRIACEYKIQEEKWANSHWPVENDSPKPAFTEIADQENIKKIVLSNLKKETVLQEHFGITFTAHQIQTELNRIVQQTKAPERLKEIFRTFDNNTTTIAECLIRPSLVNKAFKYQYHSNYKLHNDLRKKAEKEIADYQKDFKVDVLYAEINNTVYRLKLNDYKSKSKSPNKLNELDLNQDQWDDLLGTLDKSNQLVEKSDYFIYQRVVSQNIESIVLETLTWKKEPSEKWLANQNIDKVISPNIYHNLKLNEISGQTQNFSKNNSDSGFWEDADYVLQGRRWHTAIWTGNEMIIWGGNYYEGIAIYLSSGYRYDPITDTWAVMSKVNAPSERKLHTAVWNGNEMIVWGGRKFDKVYNNGAKYNPNTDSWSDINTISSPTARASHTAIIANNEMIVWGGSDNNGLVNTGARYDIFNDTWQNISTNNAPIGRAQHSVVWTGNEMIVWGGQIYDSINGGVQGTETGGRYNPLSNSWVATSLTNAPLSSGNGFSDSAIWTGNEMIVPASGGGKKYNPVSDYWLDINSTNAPLDAFEENIVWTGTEMIVWQSIDLGGGGRYNPVSDQWTTMNTNGEPSLRLYGATSVWTGEEMIIWGGRGSGEYDDRGARYNPISDNWSEMSTVVNNLEPINRSNHTAIWTGSEMIIWGGEAFGQYLNSGGRYDPLTHSWKPVSMINIPEARKDHTAVWTGREMIVWGGQNNNNYLNSVGKYDPISNTWGNDLYAHFGLIHHTAIWTGREMIVWGGQRFSGQWQYYNLGFKYNPTEDTWTQINSGFTLAPRARHTAIWTGEKMIVWGGEFFDGNYTFFDTGATYDPFNGEWTETSTAGVPEARATHNAVWTGNQMLVWGGTGNGLYQSGGKFDPINNSWISMTNIDAPSGRYDHSSVWTGREMLVWGGFDGNYLNTGGKYNPITDTWTETTLLNAPESRDKHTAVWTGREMIIWGGKPEADLGIYRPNNPDLIFKDGFED